MNPIWHTVLSLPLWAWPAKRTEAGGRGVYRERRRLYIPLPPTPSHKGRGRILPTLPFLLPLFLLASCVDSGAPAGSPQSLANAQTAAACRQRADQVYNLRHRDTIYSPPSDVNTPFSASYAPGQEDRGLSQLFERDSMMSDCIRNTGAEGDRTPEPGQGTLPPGPVARP